MKILKNSFVFLLVLTMILSMAIPCFAKAEDGVYEVIYMGGEEGFVFVSNSTYNTSDLFENFKNVMPGDTREQIVDIVNHCSDYDYVGLYLQAIPHSEENKPITEQLKEADLDAMKEFLNKFNMTVTNMENNKIVFDGPAGEVGSLKNPIHLKTLEHGDAVALRIELTAPLEMDNTYSDQIGEVDWKFLATAFNDEVDEFYQLTVKKIWKDGNSAVRPDSVKVKLIRNDKTIDTVTLSEKNNWRYTWHDMEYRDGWEVEEIDIQKGYKESYDSKERSFIITNTAALAPTGQLNWPIPVLLIVGIILIATGASLLRKGRKNA